MTGATAQPLYDKRKNDGDTGPFDNNIEASLYFDGSNGYWGIGYIVNDAKRNEQLEQAKKLHPICMPHRA